VDFCIIKFYILINYQDQKAVVADDIPLPVPYPILQLYYGPVVTYCMVYHYTKRTTLARLLANEGPAIYVVL